MALKKGSGKKPAGGEHYNTHENARFEDTISASRTLVEGESFERGYAPTMNADMHINQGRSTSKARGLD